jgi:very-short-patch-repair endonuclease
MTGPGQIRRRYLQRYLDQLLQPYRGAQRPGIPVPGEVPGSPVERMFWDACQEIRPDLAARGILVRQWRVRAEGRTFYLDFAVPSVRAGIEIDGHATHSSPAAIARDRQRQRILERAGWRIIRFGGSEVYHDARLCAEEAIRALGRLP